MDGNVIRMLHELNEDVLPSGMYVSINDDFATRAVTMERQYISSTIITLIRGQHGALLICCLVPSVSL